jgi:hypothetical protein
MTIHTSTYILSTIPLPPHHPHPQTTTAQYNMETSNLQTFKRPPHKKDNTNTLVEKTKNSRGK